MKLETTTKLTVVALCVAFTCTVFISARSSFGQGRSQSAAAASSGPGFGRDNNPGTIGQTASDGARFSSDNNPGQTGSVFGQSTAAAASANGGNSNGGVGNGGSDSNASATGLAHRNERASLKGGNSNREEMVVTDAAKGKGGESAESSEKGSSEKAEHDPTFDGSIMNAGISPIPSASPDARPAVNPRVSPIPSASPAARPAALPRVIPIPSVDPSTKPPGVPGVSPIPSAPEGHGVDPVPSATVNPRD